LVVLGFLNVTIQAANPECTLELIKLRGKQDGDHAGTRSSDTLIKIVGKSETGAASPNASISLLAESAGVRLDHTEPTWSGHNVTGIPGSFSANWTGGAAPIDSEPKATAHDSSVKLNIKHYAPLKSTIKISKESSGTKNITEQINSWLTKYSKKPIWVLEGGVEGELQRCDFYNDASKIGWKVKLDGYFTVKAPGFSVDSYVPDLPTGIPGLYWKPIAAFDPFNFSGKASGVYNDEKNAPWVVPFSGVVTGQLSVKAGAKLGIGKDGVADASLSTVGSCTLNGRVEFGSKQRSVTLEEYKVEIGKLSGEVTLTVKLVGWVEWQTKLVDHTFWEGFKLPSEKAPAQPIVLHTFPEPI